MLKWLTERAYNRFDPVWIVIAGLALHDKNYLAAVIAWLVGVALSAVMEVAQDNRSSPHEKLREGKDRSMLKRGSNPPPPKPPKPPPPQNPPARSNA